MADVQQVFQQLLAQTVTQAKQNGVKLQSYADPKLVSPAQYGDVIDDLVAWWPVARSEPADFSGLQTALEFTLHADLQTFYGSYYGGGVAAIHPRGPLELLMIWHDEDFIRLQHNIIAHILMKRRLKQQETVFIATTDDDELLISVLNSTGEVFLEKVGCEVKELLAPNLASFFQQLTFAVA
jgi:SecY interacting protein Syd